MRIRAAVLFCLFAGIASAQSTIRPGGGGGSSTITAGTTATSGCTDGAFLYSLTSLIRCGAVIVASSTGAVTIGSSSLGTSVVPLTVTPGTGSTANIQNWTNSAGTVLATVEKNGYFGIGTSAPIVQFQVHTSADKNIALYDYAGSPTIITMNDAGSVLLPMNLRASSFVFLTGSPVWGSVAPAVSNTSANSCGTTAATIAGTAETGIVTVGATSGTSCTVTFAVAAPTRRQCVVTNETTGVAVKATYSSTTVSLFAGTFAASDVLAYICQVY